MQIRSIKVVLHTARIGKLARSEEMYTLLRGYAETMANSAGDGFAVKELKGSKRARIIVYTKTKAAKEAESVHRSLTRAVAGGR